MEFTKEDIRQAYVRLKSYIYYDNTDLLLRRQLVEFETGIGKDYLYKTPSAHYNIGGDIFSFKARFDLEEKFERISIELNNYHKDPKFIDAILDMIDINFYPKKFKVHPHDENFISNERILPEYKTERVTPFINAPIELHLISVLWIANYGVTKDKELKSECLGNRLLLNKDKTALVQGSGLFKPYFNQYQKWRDDAVEEALNILKKGKNVAFINLDIKDYFSSVRIKRTDIFDSKINNNLLNIFLKIHDRYSELLSNRYRSPYNFYQELLENGKPAKIVLPIGLVSSYVLANDYLDAFDDNITSQIKPAYYGRYVDDMLFVISNPKSNFKEQLESIRFDFSNYSHLEPSPLEQFILANFYPFLDLIEATNNREFYSEIPKKSFSLAGIESLYCQSEKSLMHFFNANESHLVIDKLKQELDERTSEFRDFPEENETNSSFTSSAYHLQYDGSDGKIRTLKDYKENRYGLTVFLSNKIFSALRHENHLSDEESEQIVNFFKGETCLTFYRLWERILTVLLVNKKAKHYVEFFLHCIDEIDKIKAEIEYSDVEKEQIKDTLVEYLDVSHELSICLNLNFLSKTEKEAKNFEFKLNELKNSNWSFLFGRFDPTKPSSFWVMRFRTANMMRHHYVIHPLLTYTEGSKRGAIKNLTDIHLDTKNFKIDHVLAQQSPRRVKFWECCIATGFELISKQQRRKEVEIDGKIITNLFGINKSKKEDEDSFYLETSFKRFKQINSDQIPPYEIEDENFMDKFFQLRKDTRQNSPIVNTLELRVNGSKQDKFKIAFANTRVTETNIIDGMRGTPNLSAQRYDQIAKIVKKARQDQSDILLFPEFFIPINLLSSIVKYSERNQVLTITGLEHVKVKNTCYNLIVSILPFDINGVSDAVVLFRIKNHYAHIEESLIKGNHFKVPVPKEYRYDILIWKNLYLSPYYCFELANAWHRSLFKSKIDLLVGVEWNRDTNYFSNIVESCSRDLHCIIAQVNTSQFGDSRLTQPTESARTDLLRLKGGTNDAILVAEIETNKIREFQRKTFDITHYKKEYKPLPPDFHVENVIKRINNESVL